LTLHTYPISAFIENLVNKMIKNRSLLPSSPLFKLRKKKEGPSLADLLLQIHRAGCCFLLLVLCVFFGDLNVFQILLSSSDEGDIISSLVLV